jgi:hypothetical protein
MALEIHLDQVDRLCIFFTIQANPLCFFSKEKVKETCQRFGGKKVE